VTGPAAVDPFLALGLAPEAGLTDDDVRAAWRRVAAATHPDRSDGGDPAAFAAAAAAYTLLRTAGGRGEALADLLSTPAGQAGPAGGPARRWRAATPRVLAHRIRRGRPLLLALRVAVATVASAASVLAAGWQPASLAVITGALTWLILTGRADLSAPP
jgi:curved DNA-binding protein CbpA